MKRMFLAAATASMLALAAPGIASAAHHGKRHHRTRHARAHHARVLVFSAASTGSPTTGTGSTQTTSSTAPGGSGETAGTVTSFTGGVLTITLSDGTVVSGKVTERTEICL